MEVTSIDLKAKVIVVSKIGMEMLATLLEQGFLIIIR